MKVTPLIIGSGVSGQAIARGLALLAVTSPELGLATPMRVPRGAPLGEWRKKTENPLLLIANPHGLHAKTVADAVDAGFETIVCEKPSCVSETELARLRDLGGRARVAILHIYRAMWGPRTLRSMKDEGALGELVAVEGRYWGSSSAERVLDPSGGPSKGWKNDPSLAGEFDALIDTGVHWVDLACYMHGAPPERVQGWRSYAGAETGHRDTHVQLAMDFPRGGRALGSVSKILHGANNELEIHLIGTKKAASWSFSRPDEIVVGEGRTRHVVARRRAETTLGTFLPPFHATGWLEGYVEICRQVVQEAYFGKPGDYPRLLENLDMMSALFRARWSS